LLDRRGALSVLLFLRRERTRWISCWLIAAVTFGFLVVQAWLCFHEAERPDGNWGHTSIDFGGQWVLGRMILAGNGRHLYNRTYLRTVVEEGYPPGGEKPTAERPDSETLLVWLSGRDDPVMAATFVAPLAAQDTLGALTLLAYEQEFWTPDGLRDVVEPHLGGAFYPPIHAFLFAPLATLPPRIAYRVWQAVILVLLLFDGWLVHRITDGRVWWPVAIVFLVMFPGFVGTLNLGQNSMLSLTVVLLGWWQLARGRPIWAGVCWGLLAFKPVWAVSFLLVPILTGRWRMAASMAVTGLVQIAITLPVVGWETWLHWLQVGRVAADDYAIQENWIFLSRDLLGIPRRWLLTFEGQIATVPAEQPLPAALGWGLWLIVFLSTLLAAWLRRRRLQEMTGTAPAFVLLGAFFSCYHFMYYDFILGGLPVLVLFTEPRRYFQAVFWRPPRWLSRFMGDTVEATTPSGLLKWYYQPTLDDLTPPPMPLLPGGRFPRWVRAPAPPLLLTLVLALPALGCLIDPTNHFPPGDTFSLLVLWAWCGYRLLVDPVSSTGTTDAEAASSDGATLAAKFTELGADVGGAHEGLADEHGMDTGRL
jgi:hypothetical protein